MAVSKAPDEIMTKAEKCEFAMEKGEQTEILHYRLDNLQDVIDYLHWNMVGRFLEIAEEEECTDELRYVLLP